MPRPAIGLAVACAIALGGWLLMSRVLPVEAATLAASEAP